MTGYIFSRASAAAALLFLSLSETLPARSNTIYSYFQDIKNVCSQIEIYPPTADQTLISSVKRITNSEILSISRSRNLNVKFEEGNQCSSKSQDRGNLKVVYTISVEPVPGTQLQALSSMVELYSTHIEGRLQRVAPPKVSFCATSDALASCISKEIIELSEIYVLEGLTRSMLSTSGGNP
ncbi:hypothetical protein LJR009_005569 [Bosea sp. LjRoot9]|uniref:hypothetical protein n=1 Tax=Bosea sp. LjRoot9 TaxID=3342341 RepID=UPI003ED04368